MDRASAVVSASALDSQTRTRIVVVCAAAAAAKEERRTTNINWLHFLNGTLPSNSIGNSFRKLVKHCINRNRFLRKLFIKLPMSIKLIQGSTVEGQLGKLRETFEVRIKSKLGLEPGHQESS